MELEKLSRRQFLKAGGLTALALSLQGLRVRPAAATAGAQGAGAPAAGAAAARVVPEYRSWEDVFRQRWRWERVAKGTHCVDCYPGACSWNVYVQDGIVFREEQAALYPVIEPGVPDMNPRGCQKGASFSQVMYGPERVKYPLKRKGPRGSCRWQRVTWDEALAEIADAMIDAAVEAGPESVIFEVGPGNIGMFQALATMRFAGFFGATILDVDALIGDFNVGNYITFGKFQHCSSHDDWFHAELILIWHMNPLFTRIPCSHYITEARYKGAEVVSIAPDYNASSIHADLYVPVECGTDAALALGMCQVIVAEKLVAEDFVREQTDLPLLVRTDTRRFLRASDIEEGGRDDQFYVLSGGRPAPAPRDTLALGRLRPELDGKARVKCRDGKTVEVVPAFSLLRRHLEDYTPEKAGPLCHVSPEVIRALARKVASKRTHLLVGWNSNKYYHGDLIERAQCLLLALTGNWGKKGTGTRGWNESGDAKHITGTRRTADPAEWEEIDRMLTRINQRIRSQDPTQTEEMVAIERDRLLWPLAGMSPPVFYWYHHAGYRDVWNHREWADPGMRRPFDAYLDEAMKKGWWEDVVQPAAEQTPRVLFGLAGSTLRRTRGGYKQLLANLWPKLKLIVTIDPRFSTTALHSDFILPVAWFYERPDFRFFTPHVTFNTFTDGAAQPVGESKTEWEIFGLLARKIGERAAAKGLVGYTRRRRIPRGLVRLVGGSWAEWIAKFSESELFDRVLAVLFRGREEGLARRRRFDRLYPRYTFEGQIRETDLERALEVFVADAVRTGQYPAGTTLATYREKGFVRFVGLDHHDPVSLNLATDIKPNETVNPLRWHTERKIPYPTLTRRAQFYVDHEWFLEAGEALPTFKPNPSIGGRHPFRMTSGHQRWSIHSIWVANRLLLRTHRGEPFIQVNPDDARRKGITDGALVRVFNDFDSFHVKAKISPATRPGQVVIYHAWEPYQYPGQKPYDTAIPGMVKWLHLAGGYGHLRYWRWNWQPQQADRAIAVDIEPAGKRLGRA